jgi:hypothetical protein
MALDPVSPNPYHIASFDALAELGNESDHELPFSSKQTSGDTSTRSSIIQSVIVQLQHSACPPRLSDVDSFQEATVVSGSEAAVDSSVY